MTYQRVLALDIVYPKTNPVTINAGSTFFIGSSTDSVKINDVDVPTASNGGFAQVVELNYGENIFKIISGKDCKIFKIIRPYPCKTSYSAPKLVEYPVFGSFYTNRENVPIRLTPVASGINRLTHLPQGMQLLINGEKGGFYRVYLNSAISGWVAKSDVVQKENSDCAYAMANLKEFKSKDDDEFYVYEFEFDMQTPFLVKENGGLTLQLFNVATQPDNTFVINLSPKKLFGYDAFYEGNKFTFRVRKFPVVDATKSLKDIIIVVDAGHGGQEKGAIGCCGDNEKDINLAISKELQSELDNCGAKVYMTRESDTDVSLADRVKFAKEKNAAILVSVHANALPDGQDPIKSRGTSVYYYHNQAKALADSVLESMVSQLGTQNDKVRQGSLALVRPTSSVSVLIEVAYMINPYDNTLLTNSDFQKKCAKAIADGIENYLKN